MRAPAPILSLLVVLALGFATGCGGDETSYGDKEIIERLELERAEQTPGYALDGNLFCEVEKELLNDADEVSEAAEGKGPVVASKAGNVGIKPGAVFSPDCVQSARKKLSKLDPEEG